MSQMVMNTAQDYSLIVANVFLYSFGQCNALGSEASTLAHFPSLPFRERNLEVFSIRSNIFTTCGTVMLSGSPSHLQLPGSHGEQVLPSF